MVEKVTRPISVDAHIRANMLLSANVRRGQKYEAGTLPTDLVVGKAVNLPL